MFYNTSIMINIPGRHPGGAAVYSTWSPTDKVESVVISPDMYLASAINNADSTFQSGRATIGIRRGEKKFWSVLINSLPSLRGYMAIGWAVDTFPFSNYLGTGDWINGSAASYDSSPNFVVIGATHPVTDAWDLGMRADFAVDYTEGVDLSWQRIGGGDWNAGSGADPATGVGGFTFSGLTGGEDPPIIYPAYQLLGDDGGVGSVLLNTGAMPYSYPAPVGFSNITA